MVGKLFIVSAPSGAGKTTVVNELIRRVGPKYTLERLVTYTSKTPRIGEVDGKDYYFVTESEFKKRAGKGFFLEYSTAYGAYYGTPRSVLQQLAFGRSYLLIIDRVGAQQVSKLVNGVELIWLYTADIQVLRSRLKDRGTESTEQMNHRLTRAQKEIKLEEKERLYMHHIASDVVDCTVTQIEQIIAHALHAR